MIRTHATIPPRSCWPTVTRVLLKTVLAVTIVYVAFSTGSWAESSLKHADDDNAVATIVTRYASYWYVDDETDATIELANEADDVRDVSCILLIHGSSELSLGSFKLAPHTVARVSIAEHLRSNRTIKTGRLGVRWGDGSKPGSAWGTARLEGVSLSGVKAVIVSRERSHSLAIDSTFSSPQDTASLSSLWWKPTAKTDAFFSIFNTADHDITVKPFLYLDGQVTAAVPLQLKARQARLISLSDLISMPPSVGAVEFLRDGLELAPLVGRAIMVDEAAGFSTPMMMHNLISQRKNVLGINGTPFGVPDATMGFPRKVSFSPHLLLANLSAESMTVEPEISRTTEDGVSLWSPQPIVLQPYEARVVDLERLRQVERPQFGGFLGITLRHTGVSYDLIAEDVTTDDTLRYSLPSTFADPSVTSNVAIPGPFHLNGPNRAILVARNTTDETVQFMYQISYGASRTYRSQMLSIRPGAIEVVDVQHLVEAQVPDHDGNKLPRDLEVGSLSLAANKSGLLVSGPTYDPVHGTCDGGPNCDDVGNCNEGGWTTTSYIAHYRYYNTIPDYARGLQYCQYALCPGENEACGTSRQDQRSISDTCARGINVNWTVTYYFGMFQSCEQTTHADTSSPCT